MRTEQTIIEVEAVGELNSAKFGISTNDQAHIIAILRDRLYSDKILAVLREYTTNAWDAHKENGCDKPVKVTLPSRLNPVLKIRDFGPGISEDNIYDIYTQYGSSTKRQSNEVVGMLGIGCKSGFAYSDVFTVISYNGGTKKTYTAFIDDTNMGQMSKLAETPCDISETGIEIQIPTSTDDVPYFRNKAIDLFQYMDPRPDVNVDIPERKYSATGTCWKLREVSRYESATGAVAIMGTIGYPIKPRSLDKVSADLRELLHQPIDFIFPIGAVDVSASREDLEYTDKTMRAVESAIKLCRFELQADLKAKFAAAKNVWEARDIFNGATGEGEYTYSRHRRSSSIRYTIAHSLKIWKNCDLSTYSFESAHLCDNLEVRVVTTAGMPRSIGVSTNSSKTRIRYKDKPIVAMVNVSSNWLKSAVKLRDSRVALGDKRAPILLFQYKGDDAVAQAKAVLTYITSNQLDGIPIFNLSDYPIAVAPKLPRNVVRDKSLSKNVFKLKASKFQTTEVASNNWEPMAADLKKGAGIYMEIYGYQHVLNSTKVDAYLTREKLRTLESMGVDLEALCVVGIKTKEIGKIGPDWVEFDTWYKEQILTFVKKHPSLEAFIEIKCALEINSRDQARAKNFLNRANSLIDAGLPPQHAAVSYFTEFYKVIRPTESLTPSQWADYNLFRNLLDGLPVESQPKTSCNLLKLKSNLIQTYPMLGHCSIFKMPYGYGSALSGAISAQEAKTFADYVNVIDKQ